MAYQNNPTKEVVKTEIHNIEFHTHHKDVEIPVLDMAIIKQDIYALVMEAMADIISSDKIEMYIKEAIQKATRELVIEKPKFKEVDVSKMFDDAIKNITKEKEIVRYKEKEQEFIVPKIKFVPREIIDPVLVPTNVIDVKLVPKEIIEPILVPTKIIDPVMIKREIIEPVFKTKEIIDPVLREKIIWVDKVMEQR